MRELCGPPARLALPWQPAVWAAYVASLDPAVVVELVLEWTPGRTIRR